MVGGLEDPLRGPNETANTKPGNAQKDPAGPEAVVFARRSNMSLGSPQDRFNVRKGLQAVVNDVFNMMNHEFFSL